MVIVINVCIRSKEKEMPKVIRNGVLVEFKIPRDAKKANFVKGIDDKIVEAKQVASFDEDPAKVNPAAPAKKITLTGEETNAQLRELLLANGIKTPANTSKPKLLELVVPFVESDADLDL